MVTREINLIGERKKFSPQEENIKSITDKFVPYVLAIYALILVVVFTISFYTQDELFKNEKAIAAESERIKTYAIDEGKYLLLKQKADVLTQILRNRFPYVELFGFFRGLDSDSVKIKTLEMNEAGTLTLFVEVADSAALDTYISQLLAAAERRFTKIELTGLTYTIENTYNIQLVIGTLKGV